MKTVFWLTIAVLVLAAAAVIAFEDSPARATMHLYAQSLEQDAQAVVHNGEQLLNRTEQVLDRAGRCHPGHPKAANAISAKS